MRALAFSPRTDSLSILIGLALDPEEKKTGHSRATRSTAPSSDGSCSTPPRNRPDRDRRTVWNRDTARTIPKTYATHTRPGINRLLHAQESSSSATHASSLRKNTTARDGQLSVPSRSTRRASSARTARTTTTSRATAARLTTTVFCSTSGCASSAAQIIKQEATSPTAAGAGREPDATSLNTATFSASSTPPPRRSSAS